MFDKTELDSWLKSISKRTDREINIYLIGGCALSFKELKAITKDIDIIVISKEDFDTFDNAIKKSGFTFKTDLKDEVYPPALAVYIKDDVSRIDVFLQQVGKMLTLTLNMEKRAKPYKNYEKLSVYLVSNEDIFLFKSMSSRPGDIEDSDRLVKRGLDYDIIYNEIVNQSKQDNKWFFWMYESLCRLEEYNRIRLPIKNRVLNLVKEHWKDRPCDFMSDIKNPEKHIPDKKLLGALRK